MVWLPCSVADRWTDRQTDILPQHSSRYAYASRGKSVLVKL